MILHKPGLSEAPGRRRRGRLSKAALPWDDGGLGEMSPTLRQATGNGEPAAISEYWRGLRRGRLSCARQNRRVQPLHYAGNGPAPVAR